MVERRYRPIVPVEHGNEREHRRLLAVRANAGLPKDGSEPMQGPLPLMPIATADLTGDYAASLWEGAIVYDTTLNSLVISNGASWVTFYEAGTWVPTLTTNGTDFTSVTYDAVTGGRYVKIGSLVHIQGRLRTDAVTVGAASGNVLIGGLPYAGVAHTGSTNDANSAIAVAQCSGWAGEEPMSINSGPSSLLLQLAYRTAVDGNTSQSVVADVATGADANSIIFGGTYITA